MAVKEDFKNNLGLFQQIELFDHLYEIVTERKTELLGSSADLPAQANFRMLNSNPLMVVYPF